VAGEVARFMTTNSEFQRFRRAMGSGILGWSPRGITSPRRIFSCCLYLAGAAVLHKLSPRRLKMCCRFNSL
jgi:hypothetical protein